MLNRHEWGFTYSQLCHIPFSGLRFYPADAPHKRTNKERVRQHPLNLETT